MPPPDAVIDVLELESRYLSNLELRLGNLGSWGDGRGMWQTEVICESREYHPRTLPRTLLPWPE